MADNNNAACEFRGAISVIAPHPGTTLLPWAAQAEPEHSCLLSQPKLSGAAALF